LGIQAGGKADLLAVGVGDDVRGDRRAGGREREVVERLRAGVDQRVHGVRSGGEADVVARPDGDLGLADPQRAGAGEDVEGLLQQAVEVAGGGGAPPRRPPRRANPGPRPPPRAPTRRPPAPDPPSPLAFAWAGARVEVGDMGMPAFNGTLRRAAQNSCPNAMYTPVRWVERSTPKSARMTAARRAMRSPPPALLCQ